MSGDIEWLKHTRLSYGGYNGQAVALRKFAIEKWGIDAVATMTDDQISSEMQNAGFIPCTVRTWNGHDDEAIFLIPYDVLKTCVVLER